MALYKLCIIIIIIIIIADVLQPAPAFGGGKRGLGPHACGRGRWYRCENIWKVPFRI